jgi:hypothetical protein
MSFETPSLYILLDCSGENLELLTVGSIVVKEALIRQVPLSCLQLPVHGHNIFQNGIFLSLVYNSSIPYVIQRCQSVPPGYLITVDSLLPWRDTPEYFVCTTRIKHNYSGYFPGWQNSASQAEFMQTSCKSSKSYH